MYIGLIFDEKGVFYILAAFSSFRENVSINFEHKNFKSSLMLYGYFYEKRYSYVECRYCILGYLFC